MELVETSIKICHQDHHQMVQSLKQPLMCPRCESTNTKFCYYNNYSKSQPRHYCRSCKRYWTEGGTLRNVPLPTGGRVVKKRRSSMTSWKSKNKNMGPTGRRSCSNTTIVSYDENLEKKIDTQLVIWQKEEIFGGILSECDQSQVLETLHDNLGGADVVCCSSGQSLFDHEIEMFSFQIAEGSDLLQTNMNEVEDRQQRQLPYNSEIVDIDLRWEDEDDHHDTFCVTDFLTTDVPEIIS